MAFRFNNHTPSYIRFNNQNVSTLKYNGTTVWNSGPIVKNYVTFSAPSNFRVVVQTNVKPWDGTLEYSLDGNNWSTFNYNSYYWTTNKVFYLRGTNNTKLTHNGSVQFKLIDSNDISISGNFENLLDYQEVALGNHPIMASECFNSMFSNVTSIISANIELPFTTLTDSCYQFMFDGCSNLVEGPSELPATLLENECYEAMFRNCSSLILPPKILAQNHNIGPLQIIYSLDNMFDGCSSLTTLPKLYLTNVKQFEYMDMFRNCSNIKVSETQTGEYQYEWRLPYTGTMTSEGASWNYEMLKNTGGTFTGNPQANVTYYTNIEPI